MRRGGEEGDNLWRGEVERSSTEERSEAAERSGGM